MSTHPSANGMATTDLEIDHMAHTSCSAGRPHSGWDPRWRSLLLHSFALALGMTLVACGAAERVRPPMPAKVTVAQFGQLRWLEGRWRGAEAAGAPFFESYRFLDDSTILSFSFADSTFTTVTDSGRMQLRGDTVTSGWPVPERVAIALDSASVAFSAPLRGGNGFSWHLEGPGAWTARLPWDSAGVARVRRYEMRAFR